MPSANETRIDRTFAEAGGVALWTKADSVTRFDAIHYDAAIEHDPEKHAVGLDPRVGTGFLKRADNPESDI